MCFNPSTGPGGVRGKFLLFLKIERFDGIVKSHFIRIIYKRVDDFIRIQGAKGSRIPVKGKPVRTSENKHLNPRTPEPSNPGLLSPN
jgi:hypothetical protein